MQFVLIFFGITIFSIMLSIGVNESVQQLMALWRQPVILIRALGSVIVLVPLLVFLLLWVLDLPPEIVTGLALLAASPGAPMTTFRGQIARADKPYISSVQLSVALLAVAITPLTLAVYYAFFELTIESVSPIDVASQIARVTFLPVVVGLLLQHFAPGFTDRIREPLNKLSVVLLALLVLMIVAILWVTPELRAGMLLGWPATTAIVLMAAGALAIGHVIGGPRADHRGALATACVARNFGLALYITGLTEAGAASMFTLVVYLLVGLALATPYGLWIRRQVE